MNAATMPGRLIGKETSVTHSPEAGRSYFRRAWAMGTAIATEVTVVAVANHRELNATPR